MDNNLAYYIFCIIAFIVGIIVLRKVAGCLLKSVLFAILVAALAVIYFMYLK